MSPLVTHKSWQEFVARKWLLWDTCSINDVMSYDSFELLDELERLNVINCYIHPVQLELMATNNQGLRFARSDLLASRFIELPLVENIVRQAKVIQEALSASVQPSITDLYLGGTLATYPDGNMILLTRNVKDFRDPYFKRECYINLEGPHNTVSLAFITLNQAMLVQP